MAAMLLGSRGLFHAPESVELTWFRLRFEQTVMPEKRAKMGD